MTNQFILCPPKDAIDYPLTTLKIEQETLTIQLKFIEKLPKDGHNYLHKGVSSLTGIAQYKQLHSCRYFIGGLAPSQCAHATYVLYTN